MPKPYVTVLIDTYNHERFIEKAIASVFDQDFPSEKMEILVVDDGSTDQTPEIVRKFEPRLRLIRKGNGGQGSAFNVGIEAAQGEFVAFLDGDDWWAPQKLKEVIEAFEKNPGIGVVGHGYYEVRLNALNYEVVVPDRTSRLSLHDAVGARLVQALCDFLGTSKLTVRKEILTRILPVPEELVFSADAFLSFPAIAIAGATILDRPLCYYRLHEENLWETSNPGRLKRKMEIMECILKCVHPALALLGTPQEALAALTDPWKVHVGHFRLLRDGGMPWRTFQVERTANRVAYADSSLGYKLFKTMALGLCLLMPPRRYYQLKQWYADRGLRRYREKVGDAVVRKEPSHTRRESVSSPQSLSEGGTVFPRN